MTKEKIVEMFEGFKLLGTLSGVKFAYFVSKNLSTMLPEVKAIYETLKNSDEYEKYEQARLALAKSHAELDKNGAPKMEKAPNGVEHFVLSNVKAFEDAFKVLKDENKELLEARKKQEEDYKLLLKEESTVKLHKIKMENVPTDITVEQMNVIFDLIED